MKKRNSTVIAILFLLTSLSVLGYLVAVETASAPTESAVTWDLHVVAGANCSSGGLPPPAPQPAGFNFTVVDGGVLSDPPYTADGPGPNSAAGGIDFGKVLWRPVGEEWILERGWVKVDVTNELDYDILITNLTAEVTSGTPTEDFYSIPAGMWFANFSLVGFDAFDLCLDEVDYNAEVATPMYDRCYRDDYYVPDGAYMAVGTPLPETMSTGVLALLDPDSDGDAVATNHVAPIPLEAGETFTEYYGPKLYGNATSGTMINGTITLTLSYQQLAMPPSLDIIEITPAYVEAYPEWGMQAFNVTVKNIGADPIDLNVTTYYLTRPPAGPTAQNIYFWTENKTRTLSLSSQANATLVFNWDFADVPLGLNALRAIATSVVNTTHLHFDKLVSGECMVKLPGDVDADRDVDSTDVFSYVALAYGKVDPDPEYQVQCDFDLDGDVDSTDVFSYLALNYGQAY